MLSEHVWHLNGFMDPGI